MSKKTQKKKKSYRLRRSVRRTLGALFMISAIIIAAIPFPDAAATDTGTGGNTGTGGTGTTSELKYEVTDANVNAGVSLTAPTDTSKIRSAYSMKQDDSGRWIYQEQFKYYLLDGTTQAIICQYNNPYFVQKIALESRISDGNYALVEGDKYQAYFNTQSDAKVLTLTLDSSDSDKERFKYYFPKVYETYEENVKNYNTALAKWQKDPDNNPAPNKDAVTVKGDPTTTDLDVTKRGEFYCDYEFEGGILKGRGCEMVYAEQPTGNVDAPYKAVYVARSKNKGSVTDLEYREEEDTLFLYNGLNSYDLVGIGTGAFKGVTTAVTLELPGSLLYIGDEAFAGSYVTKIIINSVEEIGNRAFANSQLQEIEWSTSTKRIGTEAFSNTNLTTVNFPYSIEEIGQGAFSNNQRLQSITFDNTTTGNAEILDFAFYNCPMLGSLDLSEEKISSIGTGAFALNTLETGNCTRFVFPKLIEAGDDLGDYILAGRMNMKQVVMPSMLGRGQLPAAALKDHIFEGCVGLEYVEFPDENYSCGYVTFGKDIFSSVTNENFYVKGPALASDKTTAMPRRSTWACTMANGSSVPYVYMLDGEQIYEVSKVDPTTNEGYLMSIDSKGVLRSCNFMDKNGDGIINSTDVVDIPKLTIPGQVGTIQVTGIADGCFTKEFLEEIEELEISDGGALREIDNNVFAGATAMATAYIGDSVEIIGNEAFMGNTSLTSVTMGEKINQIGARAFKGCVKLENVIFEEPADLSTFPLENLGEEAFSTGANALTITGGISSGYGPFAWAMQSDNYVNPELGIRVCYKTPEPTSLTVILDNRNNYPTLVDYPHYETLKTKYSDLINRFENGGQLTPAEEALVKASLNVIVPDGVQSLDTEGYFNNTSKEIDTGDPYAQKSNSYSINTYFDTAKEPYVTYAKDGVFRNDTNLEQLTLTSVKYLPEEVFDGCTNLQTVQIGADLEEIEALPFIHCDALTSVGFEGDQFECNNGIVYKNNDDGTKTLLECLTSRGLVVGSSTIDVNNDPDLATVAEIEEAAFKDCKNITSFDLTGVSSTSRIPDSCFAGCEMLNTVDLPKEIRKIGDKAFATGGNYLAVTVRGREVGLGDDAFGNDTDQDRVKQAYLISYEDSAVRSDAKSQGANVERTLDELYTFKFYDEKGLTLLKTDYVEHGGTAEPPEDSEIPVITGKEFVGWNRSLKNITEDGFALAVYEGDGTGSDGSGGNGSNGNGTGGNGSNGNGTGGSGSGDADYDENGNRLYKLEVIGGIGSGSYPAGTNVEITSSGGAGDTMFANWSSSNQALIFKDSTKTTTVITMPASDATVIANYTGRYTLEVEYGDGDGSYAAGAKVTISAVEPPAGKKFSRWVTNTNGLNIENSTREITTITMPASNAKITATYANTGTTSGNSTTGSSSQNGTSITITKPGISDKDKASAYVSGSSDNFIVKISESLEAAEEVQRALAKEYPDMTRIKYFAMDISLYDATGKTKITNTNGLKVNITIPIPDDLREYAGNNKVGAVVDGSLEKLNPKFTTIDGVPSISFTATHFSPYTIYVDTGNITVGSTLDETPKTGDGIHPKWFLSIGLACISMILFMKKDPKYKTRLS